MSGEGEASAGTYVFSYAWDCPACGEVHETGDVDQAGTVEVCGECGTAVRLT